MRQGFLAGLIVVAFGLPLGIVADGKEFAREYDALRAAAGGDMGPFKAIWMASAAAALPAPKEDQLATIQQWGAWQIAQERAHPETARTRAVAESAFMANVRRFAISTKNPAEAGRVTRQLASLRGAALATVVSFKGGDIAAFPDAENGTAHLRLGALVDEFSIAAHAEEAPTFRTLQSPATPDVTSRAAAGATNGGEDAAGVAPASVPPTIAANAGREAAANSSGFVDIAQMASPTGSARAVPIPGSVPGLIDVSITSN